MEIIQAFILGIIEGITEFLPISSTGHLIVAEELMGYQDAGKLFTIAIQMGAIAAVMWHYRKHLSELVTGLVSGNIQIRKFWVIWIVATIPAGIFGLLLNARLETYAVSLTVALALIIGGVVMWLVEEYHNSPRAKQASLYKISTRQAVKIGFFQVLALVPGVSRSGATIIGGMLSGLDRVTATAFSFYLGIPVILLAGTYKLLTEDASTITGGSAALIVGLVTSFVGALLVIRWLLNYVSKNNFKLFAYYRIAFGSIILILLELGLLST